MQAHEKGVQYIAWNRDGSRLVSSGFDGTVSLFDGTTGMLLGTVAADTLIVSADFEPDGQTVLIASNYQGIYRWNTAPRPSRRLGLPKHLPRPDPRPSGPRPSARGYARPPTCATR